MAAAQPRKQKRIMQQRGSRGREGRRVLSRCAGLSLQSATTSTRLRCDPCGLSRRSCTTRSPRYAPSSAAAGYHVVFIIYHLSPRCMHEMLMIPGTGGTSVLAPALHLHVRGAVSGSAGVFRLPSPLTCLPTGPSSLDVHFLNALFHMTSVSNLTTRIPHGQSGQEDIG